MTTTVTNNHTPRVIDFRIEDHQNGSLMVSSGHYHPRSTVSAEFGAEWEVCSEWRNVIDGETVVKTNPFKRRKDGRWVWLLIRKRKG